MRRTTRHPDPLSPWFAPLLLVLLGTGGACKTDAPPMTVVQNPPDLATTVIVGPPDLAMPVIEDMSFTPPDFAMICGYGQSSPAGVCGCDGEHPQACAGNFCCASGQRCITGTTARCSGPSARQRLAMGFDERRGVTLLRGGQCDNPASGTQELCTDQWQFGPTTWQPRTTPTGPVARSGAALGWDGITGNLLLFGGQLRIGDASSMSAETWQWNGTAWTQKLPAQSPPARALGTLAYDPARRRVVLFGGVTNGDMALDDTWEWDGTAWTPRVFDTSPTAREGHGMVYDQKRSRIVVHGGLAGGMYAADTWTYDGNTWTLADIGRGMPVRAYFAMAYDSDRGAIVLHGGESPGVEALSDTWEWNGTAWTRKLILFPPPGRVSPAMVYDPGRKLTLLFGGVNGITGLYSDLWSWNGTAWNKLY